MERSSHQVGGIQDIHQYVFIRGADTSIFLCYLQNRVSVSFPGSSFLVCERMILLRAACYVHSFISPLLPFQIPVEKRVALKSAIIYIEDQFANLVGVDDKEGKDD